MPNTQQQASSQQSSSQQAPGQQAGQRRKAGIARSFDLVAAEFDEQNGQFFNPIGVRLARITGLRPGDRVLDVGCGRGAALFAAVAEVGSDGYVAGVDLSPRMVHLTAEQAVARGLRNVSVRVDDVEDLGFHDGSFEAVLSSLAVIFTPDARAALGSVHRVLVPGGRFGYTSFGVDDPGWERPTQALIGFLPEKVRTDRALSPHGSSSRSARFNALGQSPEEAAALLSESGFEDIRTVEHIAVTEHAGPQEWWQALRATGWRALLETIPQDRLDEARLAAFAELEALAEPDGRLVRRTAIRYTTSVRSD